MKFVAGIDGGGTKTRVLCRDSEGRELQEAQFGPFNLNSIGLNRFRRLLEEITALFRELGVCGGVCIGAAGISNQEMVSAVAEAMARAGIANWKLVGDHVIALQGALRGRPGIALIAGTGSICFGRNSSGQEARAGGWGHLIGDEGSAYALGRDALAAAARRWDGYGAETALTKLILEELHLDSRQGLISYIYGGDKTRIAALSRLVERAAAGGDTVAGEIISHNAEQMTGLVRAVAGKLGIERAEVAMLGGMLEHDTQLRRSFQEAMARTCPGCSCVLPELDAVHGAVMLAETLF